MDRIKTLDLKRIRIYFYFFVNIFIEKMTKKKGEVIGRRFSQN